MHKRRLFIRLHFVYEKRGNNMYVYRLLLEKRISAKINQKLLKMLPIVGGRADMIATEKEVRLPESIVSYRVYSWTVKIFYILKKEPK